MNKIFVLNLMFFSAAVNAADATPAPEPCEQLRTEIAAQTGIPEAANLALLKRISGRTDCKFTAPEVYRAALGEKPMASYDGRQSRYESDDNDDDD